MVFVTTKAALYWTDLIRFENFILFLFVKYKTYIIQLGFLWKNYIKILQYLELHTDDYSKRFPIILQHFYLYSCIWLSTINLSFIILIALVVSGIIPLISKMGFAESLINLMRGQNELTNTWVTMTQSWQTNHK